MTTKIETAAKRGRGRPSTFDRQVALENAMKLFWERGYDGTSFDDLIDTMGISPSSFYNTFSSKEALYREATAEYVDASGKWFLGILSEGIPAEEAFRKLFRTTAEQFTRGDRPAGCMISLAGTHTPPSLSGLSEMMTGYRTVSEGVMADRLRQALADGEIPRDTDVVELAGFFSAFSRGMAVQARDGASRQRLLNIAEFAMKAWPR